MCSVSGSGGDVARSFTPSRKFYFLFIAMKITSEDYPYKPYSTLQNILCWHEAEKQNGHHSPYFITVIESSSG